MAIKTEERPWGKVFIDEETGAQVGRVIKDRKLFVSDEDFSLEPDSLVGSWFHVLFEGEIIWQGVIVGEPQAGRYSCSIDLLEPAAEKVQRVFALDTLLGLGDEGKRLIENSIGEGRASVVDPTVEWRLYDSQKAAMDAYIQWSSRNVKTIGDREKETEV